MKYLSIDLETTGLDEKLCQVIELAAVYDDGVSPVEDLARFNVLIHHDRFFGELPAIVMNAAIFEEILKPCVGGIPVLDSYTAYTEFKRWYLWNVMGIETTLQNIHNVWAKVSSGKPFTFNMAGKNPNFDQKFLERLSSTWTKDFKPKHRVIDPTISFAFWEDQALPNLETCKARAFPNETTHTVTHRALDDAIDVVRLVRKHFGVTF